MAAGIDAGAVTESTTYNDTGCLSLSGYQVCNFDRKARGVIPMQEILSQSLNVGATFVAQQLGAERFSQYFKGLDLGERTGVDLPAETHGLIRNLDHPEPVELANASFGQGIAMTPFEMIRALGALANGGSMVTPHLTKEIRLSSGVSKPLDWPAPVPVFKPETALTVSRMLTVVVDTKLSNGTVRIPSMSVAAKTGTAQLTKPGGGYYQDRFFHSFFGYFPSYAPRYVILLYTLDPRGVEYASETLTSTYMDLVHYLIDYYQIPPDRPDNP
jgi:cell division protein FtsI/penicillin-binding protein 2